MDKTKNNVPHYLRDEEMDAGGPTRSLNKTPEDLLTEETPIFPDSVARQRAERRTRSTYKGIPPLIHYVWFGGEPHSNAMKKRIAEWHKLMPDHAIIEWNESNLDIDSHPFMKRMLEAKQYAYASDVARLLVLRDHGGLYLDTDMRMKKSLAPFFDRRTLWSFEYDHFLSTAIMGSVAGHPLIHALLAQYDGLEVPEVNNVLVTKHFIDTYPKFRLNNKEQIIGGDIRVLPKEYFILPSFRSSKNFSVHLAEGQWRNKNGSFGIGTIARMILGDVLYFKLYNLQMGWRSDFPALERARRTKGMLAMKD
ncbi:MAG: glycosyltransferase [Flavobacteriales bacterium]|nr:hypothetical protein [Flavobacteriales bacterium]